MKKKLKRFMGKEPFGFQKDGKFLVRNYYEEQIIELIKELKFKTDPLRKSGLTYSYRRIGEELYKLELFNRNGEQFTSQAIYSTWKHVILGKKSSSPSLRSKIKNNFNSSRRYSEERGRKFVLSLSDWEEIVVDDCAYCGIPPNLEENKINTVDRVNSSLGYAIGNIQTLCFRCNQIKNNMSEDELFAHLQKILNKRKK